MKIAIVTHKDKCFLNNSIFYSVQVNAERNNYVPIINNIEPKTIMLLMKITF